MKDIHTVPRSALRTDDAPVPPEPLRVLSPAGALPDELADLSGHLFVMAAGGVLGQGAEPGVAPCLSGDGRVFRLSFTHQGVVPFARFVEGPSWHADLELTRRRAAGDERVDAFVDLGISRVSVGLPGVRPGLGVRNFSNTALVPILAGGRTVLLATYDAGRPIALDPASLDVVGAIGAIEDWKGQLFGKRPFPFVGATAHPAWDGRELFLVNYGRPVLASLLDGFAVRDASGERKAASGHSLWSLLFTALYTTPELFTGGLEAHGFAPAAEGPFSLSQFGQGLVPPETSMDGGFARLRITSSEGTPAAKVLDQLHPPDEGAVAALAAQLEFESSLHQSDLRRLTEPRRTTDGSERPFVIELLAYARRLYEELIDHEIFTDLLVWKDARDGADASLRRVRLVIDRGGVKVPVALHASAHQVAVTEHYVVLTDASFKFDLDIVLPERFSDDLPIDPDDIAMLRRLLSRPQPAKAAVYLVPREAIRRATAEPERPGAAPPEVTVIPVAGIDAEIVHHFVDHADDGGRTVRMLAVHQRATDTAEFVHASDRGADNIGFSDEDDPWFHDRGSVVGMFASGYDRNEIASYTIRVAGATAAASLDGDPVHGPWSWMVGLPSAPGVMQGPGAPPEVVDELAVYAIGFVPELVTRLTYHLYRGYRNRRLDGKNDAHVGLDEIKRLVREGGEPGALFRVRRGDDGLELVGAPLPAEPGMVFLTPQYVPARVGAQSTAPFLVVPVFRAETTVRARDEQTRELWILRAEPDELRLLCRLDASALGWRFVLHTAWLPDAMTIDAPKEGPLWSSFTRDAGPSHAQAQDIDDAWTLFHDVMRTFVARS